MADDRSYLDDETARLLEQLAIGAHQTPKAYLTAMIVAEYDRFLPGKREYAKLPQEERRARLMQALGWTAWPDPPTDAERAEWERKQDEVDEQARRIYGEGRAG